MEGVGGCPSQQESVQKLHCWGYYSEGEGARELPGGGESERCLLFLGDVTQQCSRELLGLRALRGKSRNLRGLRSYSHKSLISGQQMWVWFDGHMQSRWALNVYTFAHLGDV